MQQSAAVISGDYAYGVTVGPLSESKRKMYRRRRIAAGGIVTLVLLGGYSAIVAAAPLPELQVTLSVDAEKEVHADPSLAQQAVDAQALPAATGWFGEDQVWSNDEDTHRIASITKLVTVLVGLDAAPVEAGSDGPSYTVTDTDAALIDEVLAQDGTFAPAPVGLELTTRQMLDLILVPSANNYAISYSRWIFGSNEAFVEAASDWLARNGLDSIHIEEPSGLSDNNVGSPADIVRLAKLALENPLIAEVVGQSSVDIPGLGEITTTNRLLVDSGVIGVKTGTTFPNGYSLAAAKRVDISGREHIAVAVTLDRPDGEARATDTRAVLAAMAESGQDLTLVTAGERIGKVTTWTGEVVPLIASDNLATVLVPGETVKRTITLSTVGAGARGTEAGSIRASGPGGESSVAVLTDEAIATPDFFWRFSHPGALFGG